MFGGARVSPPTPSTAALSPSIDFGGDDAPLEFHDILSIHNDCAGHTPSGGSSTTLYPSSSGHQPPIFQPRRRSSLLYAYSPRSASDDDADQHAVLHINPNSADLQSEGMMPVSPQEEAIEVPAFMSHRDRGASS